MKVLIPCLMIYLFIEAPDGTITKYLEVFKNIFSHTENIGHYNMMMGIGEEIEV